MELERAHHRPASSSSSTTDLFICFQSRLAHSSSMRKSIVSPGRNDKPPITLQTSLSRRMRTNNGSLRGQQSPMFPPAVSSKKRGCAFENPEPSSPKVTCIGQVRVKTKKQGKKMKMNMRAYTAKRIQATTETEKNEKNGFTICEALKEFSCLLPCKSSSCEKQGRESSVSSATCGGAVYRWFVAFNGEGRTRDIELVVEQEEGGEIMERECSRRRTIFDDMDFNVDEICDGGGGDKGSRVSVCVPPKNALLLMRCRSDPVKVSALANKFMESPSPIREDDEDDEDKTQRRSCVREDEKIAPFPVFGGVVVREEVERRNCVKEDEKIEAFPCCVVEEEAERRSCVREDENIESFSGYGGIVVREEEKRISCVREDEKLEAFSSSAMKEEAKRSSKANAGEEEEEEEKEEKEEEERVSCGREGEKIETFSCCVMEEEAKRSSGAKEHEKIETFVDVDEKLTENEEDMFDAIDSIEVDQERVSVSVSEDGFVSFAMLFEEEKEEEGEEPDDGQSPAPIESRPSIENEKDEIQETVIGKESIFDLPPLQSELEEVEKQSRSAEEEEEEEAMDEPMLPDCLLLMMREPKLSMEVSEETWVCSSDFLRPWLPERHRQHQLKKLNSAGEEKQQKQGKKSRAQTESMAIHPLPPLQPPRSSCSFPISMASLIEKKLVAYEPFVLTRCKSEPMKTAAAKLGPAPEMACFWERSKIEPHRPANCEFGF